MSTCTDSEDYFNFCPRPKRHRVEKSKSKHYDVNCSGPRSLELQGIVSILKEYDECDGGINCSVCGKLYKSKVCLIKHIWEHSIYWEVFADRKNHERVLSIQAALILYSGYYGVAMDEDNVLTHLLVTSPGNHSLVERKVPSQKKVSNEQTFLAQHHSNMKLSLEETSPLKRKRGD